MCTIRLSRVLSRRVNFAISHFITSDFLLWQVDVCASHCIFRGNDIHPVDRSEDIFVSFVLIELFTILQLASLFSIYGCWTHRYDKVGGATGVDELARLDRKHGDYGTPTVPGENADMLSESKNMNSIEEQPRETYRETANIWGYVFQIVFQVYTLISLKTNVRFRSQKTRCFSITITMISFYFVFPNRLVPEQLCLPISSSGSYFIRSSDIST